MEFEYCIIFDDANISSEWGSGVRGIHFYNRNIADQIKACLYIMHLPRTIYDVNNITDQYWYSKEIIKAHNIVFLPGTYAKNYKYRDVALTIYIGDSKNQAEQFCEINNSFLGCVNLNNELLKEHWMKFELKYCSQNNNPKKSVEN